MVTNEISESFSKRALSVDEVNRLTGLGRTKIYELMNAGVLPARKLGRKTLILGSDLENFLAGLENYRSEIVKNQPALNDGVQQ